MVMKGRKGYLYTIAIILLIAPLVLLAIFYTSSTRTTIEDTAARIRCDELYYFVQDVSNDIDRALVIFGRRAAIYAIDDVVSNNRTLWNYTYQNCSDFIFENNAAEAAIAELILCGTLYAENVTYMVNHTLPVWMSRIGANAEEMHYDMNFSLIGFKVVPYDAWSFAQIASFSLDVADQSGLCYYSNPNITITTFSDIIGLEDPLYPIHTSNRVSKPILNCTPSIALGGLAGCSTENRGDGIGSGNIVFVSNIGVNNTGAFCQNPSAYGYDSKPGDIILVYDDDVAFGNCHHECFDIESPYRLAGVIGYAKNNPQSCNITIPWIWATGKIDDETQQGQGHKRDPDCLDGDISTGICAVIRNIPDCEVYEVRIGYSSEEVNTTCYWISDISGYGGSCEPLPDGPSFFDRLDGRLNLSSFYANQSLRYFGNAKIGIETFVNPYDLAAKGVAPKADMTWIDYLYWASEEGSQVQGVCSSGEYDFMLDCPHAYLFGVDTDVANGSGMAPVSVLFEPANDTVFEGCPSVMLTGGADDCDGEVVSVSVSINGFWFAANLSSDGRLWSRILSTSESGKYLIKSRAVDNEGMVEGPKEAATIFITGCPGGDNTPPGAPTLYSPNTTDTPPIGRTPSFYWSSVPDASGIHKYHIQAKEGNPPANWNSPQIDAYAWSEEYHQLTNLKNNQEHSWRVRAQDGSGNWGDWSAVWLFKT
jgi:hypothetical protein